MLILRVRELLKLRKKTMRELADALNMTWQGLNLLLKRENPSITKLKEIASFLGVSVDSLLADVGTVPFSYIFCPKCGTAIRVEIAG